MAVAKPVIKNEIAAPEVPDIIFDNKNNKRYKKGKFLGKGGFAKCYELTDTSDQKLYAGKVVSKRLLVKQSQKEKMTQEINIHRTLNHPHVVGFHGYFEDVDNIYILLEYCERRSMMELHKRRSSLSEPEVRYYSRQMIQGCMYLHENRVIHRDLKLGNIFLNHNMEIKLGDFGLATRIDFEGERKKTLCGTPNYIAPEILMKTGHSFEVDAWSLGCIVYTLLVGKPPFETSSLKDTYKKIQKNDFSIPAKVSQPANRFIVRLLSPDPNKRPNVFSMLDDDFFKGYIPNGLPTSALTTRPRFDTIPGVGQFIEEAKGFMAGRIAGGPAAAGSLGVRRPLTDLNPGDDHAIASAVGGHNIPNGPGGDENQPSDCWLSDLLQQVTKLLHKARETPLSMEDSEHPASVPIFWVSKWVDYSDRYGLGYQLCDNSCGVLFNDTSRFLLTSNEQNIQYIQEDGTEHLYTAKQYPAALEKKVTLLHYFRGYMQDHLLKAGDNIQPREADGMIRLPFLRTWFRTKSAIVLHLSNGTLQLNFFGDHTKIILCPLMSAVTYIDAARDFKTYKFSLLRDNGITKDLHHRLEYAITMMQRMIASKSSSGKIKISGVN